MKTLDEFSVILRGGSCRFLQRRKNAKKKREDPIPIILSSENFEKTRFFVFFKNVLLENFKQKLENLIAATPQSPLEK